MKYAYEFSVWPEENHGFGAVVFDLFRLLLCRTVWEGTESEFTQFRAGLAFHGFTLREVSRTPYHEPESVL